MYDVTMPTPHEAVARADGLYYEARQRVQGHLNTTGEIHPGHMKALGDAGVAAGKIRAAAAHVDTPPEIIAHGESLRSNFPHVIAHTILGGDAGKGRSRMYPLSDDQFTSWESTGSWEGEPKLHPADVR
jgi:hypothetical protein